MELNSKESIWEFTNRLRNVVPFYGFSSSAIQLLFMKYMTGFDQASSTDDFKNLMQYQKMFISKKFDPSLIAIVFDIVERRYSIENNLLKSSIDNLRKIFSSNEEYVFAVLNSFELPLSSDGMKDLIEAILDFGENKDVSKTGISTTNTSLVKLASSILKVSEKDTYMDTFSGFSKSSIRLNAKNYLGYEINPEVAAVANMIMILTGKDNFTIKNQDFYTVQPREVADKIFSDGPIGMHLNTDQYYMLQKESKKGDYFTLKGTAEALKKNGRAIVTTIYSVLMRNDFKKLRESLTLKHLKAVIALPPMWSYSGVNTSLIVLDSERHDDGIMMIDASGTSFVNKLDRRTNCLTDDAIEKIVDAVDGKESEGFSKKVTTEDILKANEDQSWLPSHYVVNEVHAGSYRSVKEIEKDLKESYEMLYKLMEK